MAKASNSKKKKSIWSKLTGVEDEEMANTEAEEQEGSEEDQLVTPETQNMDEEVKEDMSADLSAGEAEETESKEQTKPSKKEEWMEGGENYEGQLSVDVFQTSDSIVIKSTIAGVKPEDVDVSIENDMLTIKGQRKLEEEIAEQDYFYQECYWGGFSRSIILPVEVETDKIDAALKDGVLTVTLPKAKKSKGISIKVKKEE